MGTTLGAILEILGLILGVLGGAQSALDYKEAVALAVEVVVVVCTPTPKPPKEPLLTDLLPPLFLHRPL